MFDSIEAKLTRIRSPWRRVLISVVVNVLVALSPILTDEVLSAWQSAHQKLTDARYYTSDFFAAFVDRPKLIYRAMTNTWKSAFHLFGVALRVTVVAIFRRS